MSVIMHVEISRGSWLNWIWKISDCWKSGFTTKTFVYDCGRPTWVNIKNGVGNED